ncbi:MAG TPA: signal peptide peptidase SppA [Verrucomicrobia bacterium]|nr:signal peptide peptidase SppA [Verrucomicrobiota bacterium]
MARRKSRWGFWVAIGVLIFLLLGSWLLNLGLMAAFFGSEVESDLGPIDAAPSFDEIWSSGYGDVKVVRLKLSGLIMRGTGEKLFGVASDPVETLLRQIRCAEEDEAVQAILLEVDSPGGAVTPSDEIYEALRRFRASKEGRRVVVHIRDLGASGAYYVAMAADYLMAEPTAIVGSVGVIMQSLNMKGLSDKVGLSAVTIKSGKNKDLLNPFEEVNPNQVALLQEVVDGMQDRFAGLVVEARGLESRALLDGRIFLADAALQAGLIDGVGYMDEALAKMAELIEVNDLYVVRYEQKMDIWDAFLRVRVPSLSVNSFLSGPRFLYLWRP